MKSADTITLGDILAFKTSIGEPAAFQEPFPDAPVSSWVMPGDPRDLVMHPRSYSSASEDEQYVSFSQER